MKKHLRLFALLPAAFACGGTEAELMTETTESPLCVYPMGSTFGVADNFDPLSPDPIPYNPAYPPFVAYLNGLGIPTADMKTFDDDTPDQTFVATLRHGLRSCFAGATSLNLCLRARAHADRPGDDRLVIYDTNFTLGTFPVVASASVPSLTASGTWNVGDEAGLCVDLTAQMVAGQIGDMLQLRLEDDTQIDVIGMNLF